MPGTPGALRLIERAATSLSRTLIASVERLQQAVANANGSDAAVSEAASAMMNQLRLRQAAWGPAGDPVPLYRITALAGGLPNQVMVDLSALHPASVFSASAGHILLNILLLAADSLPDGGQVVVAGSADDIFIRLIGPQAAWPAGLALCLANEAEAHAALTDGRDLQMALTAALAHGAGIRLSALIGGSVQTEPAILRLGR